MPSLATEECVLVVDDDKDIRDALVDLLRENGCRAVGAANGRVALDALKASPSGAETCLILLDMMMPVMDGREFLDERVKDQRLADIPVVVISAHHDLITEVSERVRGFLAKPLELRDVLALAKRYCDCDAQTA